MSSSRSGVGLRSAAASSSSSSRAFPHDIRVAAPSVSRDARSIPAAAKDSTTARSPVGPAGSRGSVKEVRLARRPDGSLSIREAPTEAAASSRAVDSSEKKDGKPTLEGKAAGPRKAFADGKNGGSVKHSYDDRSNSGGAQKAEVKVGGGLARSLADAKAASQGKITIDSKTAAGAAKLADGRLAGAGRSGSAAVATAQQQQPLHSSAAKGKGLPPHTEEDLLKGLTLQAIWSENIEFTSLISAALRICRLSPAASDGDWSEAQNNFLHLLAMAKARLSRQQSLFQAKYHDLESMLDSKLQIQRAIKQRDNAILKARKSVIKAKRNRRNREEYEALASDIVEKSSVAELHALQRGQMEKKNRAEKKAKLIQGHIASKYQHAQVLLKAAAELLQPTTADGG